VANGVVYVGSDDGNVYALNASTGAPLWSFATGDAIYRSSPAVANGVVYVGSAHGNYYALSASTGAQLWNFNFGFDTYAPPVVSNGVVYLGVWDAPGGHVYAFGPPPAALVQGDGVAEEH
jgi:outer membrane protein assembly factor BamB